MAARKTASKTATAKKAAPEKTATKKTPAKKTAAKKAPATKAAAKSTAAKKTPAKKAPAKKAAVKKTPAKKTAVKKTPAKKTAVKKAPATTAPAKKASAKSTAAKTAASEASASAATAFSERFLAAQRTALVEQRATYERQSRSLRDEAASLVEDFQSGDVQFDEESGEGDTLNVQREQDLMMSSQAQSAIEEIDHALAKFDLGTYGICEVSGKPIPKARLEAIPWARERIEYKVGGLTSR